MKRSLNSLRKKENKKLVFKYFIEQIRKGFKTLELNMID